MKKYVFKFIEDGKERQKTINAEDLPEGLEKLFNLTSGEKLEDIKVICKGEITNDKNKKERT